MGRTLVSTLALFWLVGCGTSCEGCGSLEPFPDGGRFVGEKMDNAMNVRITDAGFGVLNSNWQVVLGQVAPGQQLVVPLPCTLQSFSLLGNVAIADEGSMGCTAESCGQLDGRCDAQDVPRQIPVTFSSLRLDPKSPDEVEVTVNATVATGKIMVDTVSRNHLLCAFQNPMKCGVDFDTRRADVTYNELRLALQFAIDTRWDRLMRLTVTTVGGSQVCGSAGALPKPACLDPADLVISSEAACTGLGSPCDAVDWEPVKAFVLGFVVNQIKKTLQETLDEQTCQTCGTGLPPCPQLPGASSTCSGGLCVDTTTQKCVPAIFGADGRLPVGTLMSAAGVPTGSALDLSLALGGSASADTGLNLGLRGGARALFVPSCVKPLPAPPLQSLAPPLFDADAPGLYAAGVSVSRQFMDHLFHHAHQSGAMCLTVSSATFAQLDSGLFRPVLPSLGKLVGSGVEVPMQVVLRPQEPPTVHVGRGTYDPVTNKPVDPLLRVDAKNLEVDFYALLDDRFVRLFTLTADVSLPMSLVIQGCSSLSPVLGDLRGAVTRVTAINSEILAEDLTVLESLVPTFIALAEPQLSTQLTRFDIPPFGVFKLKLLEARGVGNVPGTQSYEHLGLYAHLLRTSAACAVSGLSVRAQLARSVIPPLGASPPSVWPSAFLRVSTEGRPGTAEYSVRINRGLWSELYRPNAQGELEVTHPAFLLQGRHHIEVRARVAEEPHGLSAPVEVGFTVDQEAPALSLREDRLNDRLVVEASDRLTSEAALQFAYRLADEQTWSDFGPARLIALSAVEARGGVLVRVRDEAGHVSEATWRTPTVARRPEENEVLPAPAQGCAAAPGELAATCVVLLAAVRLASRRKSSGRVVMTRPGT